MTTYTPVTFDPGEEQFALVSGDRVLDYQIGYPEGDNRTWLPIVNVDTQPFDAALHWREKPTLELDGNRVLRVYPVRLKS